MEAITGLLQDVKFRERFRGYDSAEVDAYVIAVAKAAAQLQGRLMELQQRVHAAEDLAAEALLGGSGQNGDGEDSDGEDSENGDGGHSPYQVLTLAQRTADAAVAEARQEASSTVEAARRQAEQTLADAAGKANAQIAQADGDARTRLQEAEYQCSLLRAEAEADRERILEEARRRAIEVAEAERDRIMAEVSGLEAARAGLRAEVDTLQNCRSEHLSMLTGSITAIQTAIEGMASVSPLAAPSPDAVVRVPPAAAHEAAVKAPLVAPSPDVSVDAPPATSGSDAAVEAPLTAPSANAVAEAPQAVPGGDVSVGPLLAVPGSDAAIDAPSAVPGGEVSVEALPEAVRRDGVVDAPPAVPGSDVSVEAPPVQIRGDAASSNGPAAFQAAMPEPPVPEPVTPEPVAAGAPSATEPANRRPGLTPAEARPAVEAPPAANRRPGPTPTGARPAAEAPSAAEPSNGAAADEPSAAVFDTSEISNLVPPTPPNRLVTATDIDMVAAGLNVLDRRQTASASALAAPDMAGPATQPMPKIADDAADAGAADRAPSFFDDGPDSGLLVEQLRQAVTEDDPLPGSEEAMVAFFGADPGSQSKGWFRARR